MNELKKVIGIGSLVLALYGCSKNEVVNNKERILERSSNDIESEMRTYMKNRQVESDENGLRKIIFKSPYGRLEGIYRNIPDCPLSPRIELNVIGNNTLSRIEDCEADDNADLIILKGYRSDRKRNPKEFELADKILLYWKGH